jgi:hypothetical protein
MSNLVDHARRELARVEQGPEGDRAFADSLLRAVEGFASYPGHSGGSAMVAVDWLTRLLRFENLSPLTSDPAEWTNVSDVSGDPLWQSKRCSEAFSDDGGRTYWLLSEGAHSGNRAPRHEAAVA